MIELKQPRPPASREALAATERRLADLGHRIPPSYRAFLAEQDGGALADHPTWRAALSPPVPLRPAVRGPRPGAPQWR